MFLACSIRQSVMMIIAPGEQKCIETCNWFSCEAIRKKHLLRSRSLATAWRLYCWKLNEVKSRSHTSRPRTALPRTDPLEVKGRNAPGQGQRPRTQAQELSEKNVFKNFFWAISKKKVFKNFFRRKRPKNFFSSDLRLTKTKKGLCKISARFLAFSNKILTAQKTVLS